MDTQQPLISILIVNYNGGDVLNDCLNSLERSNYKNLEIIVVDNGSTDGSARLVEENHKEVRLVRSPTNLGFAAGNNLALESAKGKYVTLLNGDTEVEPSWLDHLVGFAESHPEGGAFTPKVLFFGDKDTINSAGGLCDIYGYSPLRGTFEKDRGQFDKTEEVFYSHGAATMIRKDLVDQIGLLDGTYFIYHEELDLCWRVWMFGYKVYYIPESFVYHKLQKRLFYSKGKLAQRHFLLKRNRILTIVKNHKSPLILFISLVVTSVVSLVELLYYLIFRGDTESPKGIIRGFLWNAQHLSEVVQKRREVQKLYRVEEGVVLAHMQKRPFAIDVLLGIISGKYSLPL